MSFWRTFGFQSVTPIETILDKDHFTLEELLDEDDLLTECKGQNRKLLDFLIEPNSLQKLVHYLTADPEDPSNEKLRFKYPYLACEVLCLDVWDISQAIFSSPGILDTIWSFFSRPSPIDSLLCFYVTKLSGILLQRQTRDMLEFLKGLENFVPTLVRHFDTPTVSELLLKIASADDTNEGAGTLQWLVECQLVPTLLSRLNPSSCATVHENVSQTFEQILEQIPASRSSPFVDALLSEESLDTLISGIRTSQGSLFLSSLNVLLKVAERFTHDESVLDPGALDSQPLVVRKCSELIECLGGRLSLPEPPAGESSDGAATSSTADSVLAVLPTSYRKVIVPLGSERLKILEFFSSLIRFRSVAVDNLLMGTTIMNTTFQLFSLYPWNNFLHTNVRNLVSDIFSGTHHQFKMHLLTKCNFLDLLVDCATANQEEIASKKSGLSSGLGYMGFVTQMSNGINHACSSDPELSSVLTEHPKWKDYTETLLEQTNVIERTEFGDSIRNAVRSDSSSDDSGQYEGGGSHEIVSVFKQYLSQHQFTGNYPTSFGDNDDDDEYDDDDSPAPIEGNDRLVLDRGFEQEAQPYPTQLSGYQDDQFGEGSSEEDQQGLEAEIDQYDEEEE